MVKISVALGSRQSSNPAKERFSQNDFAFVHEI
jgi:hypothetical protein